jgi:hypothetical protein
MEYRYIAPQELRNWWASVRTGLEKIKSRSPENWIIEDVYTDCFNKQSLLFVLIENNHYAGFLFCSHKAKQCTYGLLIR